MNGPVGSLADMTGDSPSSTSSPVDPAARLEHTRLNTSTNPPSSSNGTVTAAAASSSSSTARVGASAAPAAAAAAADGDIEMEPIVGHRRRKSSLLNPPNGQLNTAVAGPARGLPQSPASALPDEPKIPEVAGASSAEAGSAGNDDQGRDSFDFSDDDWHNDEEMGLTDRDRRQRQKKKRRNTMLDQRIVREKNMSADERKKADRSVVKRLALNGVFIGLWYMFSLSISLYNKWMFDEDNLNFAFPLFTTSMHMLVQFALASLVLYFVPSVRPGHGHSSDQGRSRHESEPNKNGSLMTKMFYLTRIGPCGAATGLDIGLGNTSLKFISLTFYTMCKSSSLAFVLLFAFTFGLEKPTWRLVAIIATMTLGVVLMVFGEVEFKLGGFILVISAAFFSGFRWGLTQILLLRNPATSNPFSTIFFLTPVMFFTLLALAIPVEGFGPLMDGLAKLSDEWGVIMTPLFLMFPGCIAFCMAAAEFALLQRTSVVTLSIAGIFKEVVTISAASVVFDDELTVVNIIGLLTTLAAIVAYNYIKITKMREEAQVDVHGHHSSTANQRGEAASSGTSNNGTDRDNDDANEETAGLLRQSMEMVETLFSADGEMRAQSSGMGEPKEHRSERED